MKRETIVWTVLMLLGAAVLTGRAAFTSQGMGREYVHPVPVANGQWIEDQPATYADYQRAVNANPSQTDYRLSRSRSVGLWARRPADR